MEFNTKKIPSYLMVATIIAIIVYFNIVFFKGHISSNNTRLVDYELDDTDIHPVRESAVAGLFYPADTYQLDKDLDGYLEHTPSTLSNRPKMMIVPHAGYRYSAQVAAFAYKRLQPFSQQIKTVFLLGPSHFVPFEGVALPASKQFKTPLGNVSLNTEIINDLAQNPLFSFNAQAHQKEHSLEVQLPFLQKTLSQFSIVPLLYGQVNPEDIAKALLPYLQNDSTLLVISADLSHYLDYETAQAVDKVTAEQIDNGEPVSHHQSCGATAVNTAMLLAKEFGLVPQLLDMVNSGDTSDDKMRVVGYGAWVYEEPEIEEEVFGIELEQKHLQNFARHNKKELLHIVQASLERAVKEHKHYQPKRRNFSDVLFDKGASFVTLEKNGRLRGCIGSLFATKGIALDLANNAYAAALHDSRFKPVKSKELKNISFTISLLTSFEEIKFSSYADFLTQIKPHVDGLLIQDGEREGVFLPSVWDDFPDKQDFVTQLKIKAGLSPTYWSDKVKVFRFRTVEIKNDDN